MQLLYSKLAELYAAAETEMNMKWTPKPTKSGEHIIAFENTANGLTGFRHITINSEGVWVEPSDEQQLVYFGSHMHVTGYARLTFPRKRK